MQHAKPPLRFFNFQHFFATGFGAGFFPWAPGTAGSLMGWGSFSVLNLVMPAHGWAAVILITFILGAHTCHTLSLEFGQEDPPQLAIDEVVAMWMVLALLPAAQPTWAVQLLGFALFRLFDIVKKGPVGWVDRKMHGGLGIMLDDLVAAGLTVASVYGLVWLRGHFGPL